MQQIWIRFASIRCATYVIIEYRLWNRFFLWVQNCLQWNKIGLLHLHCQINFLNVSKPEKNKLSRLINFRQSVQFGKTCACIKAVRCYILSPCKVWFYLSHKIFPSNGGMWKIFSSLLFFSRRNQKILGI